MAADEESFSNAGAHPSSEKPYTQAEIALREALEQLSRVNAIAYGRSWFAGMSDYPGDGSESVELKRDGEDFAGFVNVRFRDAGLATITCKVPIRMRARQIDSLLGGLIATNIGYGNAGGQPTDYSSEENLLLYLPDGKRLWLASKPASSQDFWEYVMDDGPRLPRHEEVASSQDFWEYLMDDGPRLPRHEDVCGLHSPNICALVELLRKKYRLSEQSKALWRALKTWRPIRHA